MKEIATASINSFGNPPNADVLPSEESIFVLTSSQLRQIVSEAIQPLQDHIESLETTVASQGEKIVALEASQAATVELIEAKRQENIHEFDGIYRSLTIDRNRLDELSNLKKQPGEIETARAEKIRKYLLNRPDHRATYETLKGHLGVDKVRLSEAIKALMTAYPGQYGFVGVHGDKRKKALTMLQR